MRGEGYIFCLQAEMEVDIPWIILSFVLCSLCTFLLWFIIGFTTKYYAT